MYIVICFKLNKDELDFRKGTLYDYYGKKLSKFISWTVKWKAMNGNHVNPFYNHV